MASKNVRKVLRKIYSQSKTFHPRKNPVSWNKAVKYVKAKDKRLSKAKEAAAADTAEQSGAVKETVQTD